MKFLLILSWVMVFVAIFDFAITLAYNEHRENKILGRKATVAWSTVPSLILSVTYLIYWYTK